MPTIAEILAAKKAQRAAQAPEPLPSMATDPAGAVDMEDPDNLLIAEAVRIFGAQIEENPPEIATPFGPRVAEGDDHSV